MRDNQREVNRTRSSSTRSHDLVAQDLRTDRSTARPALPRGGVGLVIGVSLVIFGTITSA
jgi:hypothetical protein